MSSSEEKKKTMFSELKVYILQLWEKSPFFIFIQWQKQASIDFCVNMC